MQCRLHRNVPQMLFQQGIVTRARPCKPTYRGPHTRPVRCRVRHHRTRGIVPVSTPRHHAFPSAEFPRGVLSLAAPSIVGDHKLRASTNRACTQRNVIAGPQVVNAIPRTRTVRLRGCKLHGMFKAWQNMALYLNKLECLVLTFNLPHFPPHHRPPPSPSSQAHTRTHTHTHTHARAHTNTHSRIRF